ncbi:MAG: phosphoglycerate dehydrogenase [Rhodospirillaceae bacterium]|nr:phosphoglycerate dehydrogenase [Rhodospirillaceae bacterium]MBT3908167.1 phosphoglycerate dehydrogenase [Rhodospirillaceae bacterium]MBT5300102.1 phosphoglycerate dehydrogenase [Rhodospirillaceae bacterium]MBT5513630.1 phosphoglycerate dehydrogenase [Rhodospirillaceae bacterium]MBT6086667.1 phosphoglycerate dehydrogenase [Rhodospirillaceae bacterium]
MVKVLISDKMSPLAEQCFKARGIDVDVKVGMSPEELTACIGEYDGLAVRSATKVRAEIIEAADNLKVIGRAGIGVDNIDGEAATERGIVVMNTPFGNSITTAEHAISLMLALARQIPEANASTHGGKWEKSRFMGVELMGKTLGIIGCGNIGSVVADRAQGLKMKVIAYDPFLSPEHATDIGVEKVELDDLLGRADFISLHTPLTDATRDIINAEAIAKMKTGVRIINCARGGLLVEADVLAGLEAGTVAGVALDVFAEEPATENILFGHPGVVATPHLGAATTEAQEKVALQVAEQMADYLLSGAVTNALNMPSVSAEEAARLKPYMELAEQLGSFAGQATTSAIREVTIAYEGVCGELNCKPLTSVVLQGLFSHLMVGVNMVNAPTIAKQRDITIREVRSDEAGAYQTLISLLVVTENQSRSIRGTLFNDEPRVVEIKDIPIDAKLGPNMLYITNRDKPGLIGNLGSVLGDAGVNIATFHLGRADEGGNAIALIEVDGTPPEAVMDAVCELENVVQAIAMRF